MRIARPGRTAALVASTALVVTAVGQSPAQAAPADPTPASLSAGWLVDNLEGGLVETYSEYEGEVHSGPSYGTSIDLALALDAVGGHATTVTQITDAVAASVENYTGSGGEIYSGSAAKALALVVQQTRDPRHVGGIDLLARVEERVATAGPSLGRLSDQSQYGDYANSIGQAFAAGALTAVDSPLADEATGFLLDQQCEAGFFRLHFNADPEAAAQSCDAASPAEPAEQSSDTTALVALQLAAIRDDAPQVATALDAAAEWLVAQQQADGSFVDPQNGANANTTGLAGWALAELGRDAAAARAASWLRGLQVVDVCAPEKLAGEQGAVAYDALGWSDGVTYGISDPLDRSQWVIAGVQALPALASAPAASSRDAVVLPKFAKAGSKVSAKVRGVAAGERACTSGAVTRDLVGTGGDVAVALGQPQAGKRSVTLRTAEGATTATVQVLGKKKLKVAVAKKKVKPKARVKVTVRGLAAGERVTVKVRGKKVATVKANRNGVVKRKVRVGKARGVAKIHVRGQYATRTGTAKVRVR